MKKKSWILYFFLVINSLSNAAIQNYYTKMKQAVEANAPGLLVGEGTFSMGAVGKTYNNSKGFRTIEGNKDLRFPMTAVEYLRTDIDSSLFI